MTLNLVLDDHMNDPTSNAFVPSLVLKWRQNLLINKYTLINSGEVAFLRVWYCLLCYHFPEIPWCLSGVSLLGGVSTRFGLYWVLVSKQLLFRWYGLLPLANPLKKMGRCEGVETRRQPKSHGKLYNNAVGMGWRALMTWEQCVTIFSWW